MDSQRTAHNNTTLIYRPNKMSPVPIGKRQSYIITVYEVWLLNNEIIKLAIRRVQITDKNQYIYKL